MLGGPVFHFELVRLARQKRLFALRFVFGLILLTVVGMNYLADYGVLLGFSTRREITLGELAEFGRRLFISLISAQIVMVGGLTPAMVADAIAAERHRKTLHYLMASVLNSTEIVVGKLAARVLYLGVFLALTFPIASLLTLIGGVDPEGLAWSYVALGSTTFFLASIAILASVITRRPRDSVGAAYALAGAWLAVPMLVRYWILEYPFFKVDHRGLTEVTAAVLDWWNAANPFEWATNLSSVMTSGVAEVRSSLAWMVAMQLLYGTLFVAFSVWQLRPAFRRHEGRAGRPPRMRRLVRRILPVPECGDRPVYWKEAYFTAGQVGIAQRAVKLVLYLIMLAVIASTIYGSGRAFRECIANGYGTGGSVAHYIDRLSLNMSLRVEISVLFTVWMFYLAATAAAGIAGEREQDTWISLLSTPLEGREILSGKMLGPIRATLPFAITLAILLLDGLVVGAIHPIGILSGVTCAALFTWYVVALATYQSLKAPTAWRARLVTQAILAGTNLCCITPFIPSFIVLLWGSVFSYAEVTAFFAGEIPIRRLGLSVLLYGAYVFGGLAAYGCAAYFLSAACFRRFDKINDRPIFAGSANRTPSARWTSSRVPKKPAPPVPEMWELDE
jgi:ABC-type transport system involved in multi-copper enzyme maturation permease subunit